MVLEARDARFLERRHVGQRARAISGRDRVGPQPLRLDVRQRGRERRHVDRDLVGEQRVQRRPVPLNGTCTPSALMFSSSNVVARCEPVPWPALPKVILPDCERAERNELLERFRRQRRMHDEYAGLVRYPRDRNEVALGVERQLRVDGRIDGEADRAEEQRIAVGNGLCGDVGADAAAGAGAIVDDDRLPERLPDRIGEDARVDVGAAAGAKGTIRRIGRCGQLSAAEAGNGMHRASDSDARAMRTMGCSSYCSAMFAARTTFIHFSVSDLR